MSLPETFCTLDLFNPKPVDEVVLGISGRLTRWSLHSDDQAPSLDELDNLGRTCVFGCLSEIRIDACTSTRMAVLGRSL
jgi:hypothetical protein